MSVWNPAESKLTWAGFADGSKISSPGSPAVSDRTNPYAAMAAEMVGEIAMNAGAEYMAPEGEWNEDLGKMVYTKKKYSSAFGKYTKPEDAIWNSEVAAYEMKNRIAKRKAEQAKLMESGAQFDPESSDSYLENDTAFNSSIANTDVATVPNENAGVVGQTLNETMEVDYDISRDKVSEIIKRVNAGDDSEKTKLELNAAMKVLDSNKPTDLKRLANGSKTLMKDFKNWRLESEVEWINDSKLVLAREGPKRVHKDSIEVPEGSGMWIMPSKSIFSRSNNKETE